MAQEHSLLSVVLSLSAAWVFRALSGFSLVVVSRGCPRVAVHKPLTAVASLVLSEGSRHAGFRSGGPRLRSCGHAREVWDTACAKRRSSPPLSRCEGISLPGVLRCQGGFPLLPLVPVCVRKAYSTSTKCSGKYKPSLYSKDKYFCHKWMI